MLDCAGETCNNSRQFTSAYSFRLRHLYISFPPEPISHSSPAHQHHPPPPPNRRDLRPPSPAHQHAEAIALRLYSLPAAAGSLCAWLVAALAASVGLWRIRAVSGASNSKPSAHVDDDNQEPQAPPPPSRAAIIDEPRRPVALAPAAEPSSVSEPSTPSKVRFTAYYGGSGDDDDGVVDGVRKCADADDDDDGEVVLRRTVSEPAGRRRATTLAATAPWEERELAVRRRSDLGWYRHIDMAALDGSVVRLWDGDLTASPRGRRRRAGLELQLSL